MQNEKNHIVEYKTYIFILVILLTLTFLSVFITSIELGPVSILAALIFASVKTAFVLMYFMHLKYDKPFFKIMVPLIFLLLAVLIYSTLSDYLYR